MLSRHLWLQRPVALQPMAGRLDKNIYKKKEISVSAFLSICIIALNQEEVV